MRDFASFRGRLLLINSTLTVGIASCALQMQYATLRAVFEASSNQQLSAELFPDNSDGRIPNSDSQNIQE
jgi:glutathione peroxidase-family protein